MPKAPTVAWTRDHLLIALNLYYKLPFGKLHKGNPIIIETASRMGRTANSLAMKLCNFASLDPVLRARGIKGLPAVSKQDRQVWVEFQKKIGALGQDSEQMLHDLFTKDQSKEVDFLHRDRVRLETARKIPIRPTEAKASVKVRRGQQFFRQSVLIAYGVRCCISGMNVPQLLIASHIKPWRDFPEQRLDPQNGLCLSALHDAAFDAGLITLDSKLRLLLRDHLKRFFPQRTLEKNFASFEGKTIRLPEKLAEPNCDFVTYHRERVFQG